MEIKNRMMAVKNSVEGMKDIVERISQKEQEKENERAIDAKRFNTDIIRYIS